MDLSIVIPAYNERGNLSLLMEKLDHFILLAPCAVEVLIVDDGSTDGTRQKLDEECGRRDWLRPVYSRRNRGMGAALKLGAARAKHPLVAWVMADCSDRLDDIWEMRRRLAAGADLVVASRAVDGGSYGDFIGVKARGSRWFSGLARCLLRLPVHDCTNAFRAFRRELLEELILTRDDFAISPEMVMQAQARRKRIEEVPTVYFYRRQGMSNFAVLRMGLVYLSLTLRAFLARLSGAS